MMRTGLYRTILRNHLIATKIAALALLGALWTVPLYAQGNQDLTLQSAALPQEQSGSDTETHTSQPTDRPSETRPTSSQPPEKQPKRIFWVIPNYRAVSADTQLPPLSRKDKFWLATEDSFDYSSFVLAGIIAGISQGRNDTPEFHDGAAAYGRYYWHSFVDQAVGNYFTEALLPVATHEDPRYYTLGRSGGGFLHRTGYSLTRLLVTRNDAGRNTFNFSEVVGNAAGAAVSDLYYPRQERTLDKTAQKWLLQLGIDAVFDMAKEFWPDIDHRIFHGRYESAQR
jgi:hypothetical protein